jgi:hypothetical protein
MALKLVKTYTNGNKTAKVYKDHEWEEHRVKFYTDGVHHKEADHHSDAEDAHSTAKHWAGIKEETNMTTFVELAKEQNAVEFQSHLGDVMSEKVGAALDARKTQVAAQLFGAVQEAIAPVAEAKDPNQEPHVGRVLDKYKRNQRLKGKNKDKAKGDRE